jgi:alpha-1,6-mannosyltransferase
MRRAVLLLLGGGAALLALTIGALALHTPGARSVGSQGRTDAFLAVLAVAVVVYLMIVRFSLRHRLPPQAVWIVLGIAVAMRAVLIPAPMLLSSDIYRYVWDGRVQAAGINPYRYIPADPALTALRDRAIYPNINRATYARTIYPPMAQVIFAVIGRISQSVIAMKLVMLLCEIVAVLCMLRLLGLAKLPPERVLIYAWNPLVLWSFALDGHVDAIAVAFLGLALLSRARRWDGVAGALLAGAALVKFLPIVVAPAFLRGGTLWRPAVAGAATIALLYGLYLSAGAHVLGFLPSYGSEEGLASGGGFWLLAGLAHLVTLPSGAAAIYMACAAIGLVVVALVILRGKAMGLRDDIVLLCRDTAILAACVTAVISPHYTWYFAWLALPSVVAPLPAVLWLSVAPVLLYSDPLDDGFYWSSLIYLPAAGLTLLALWRRRGPVPRPIATSQGRSP